MRKASVPESSPVRVREPDAPHSRSFNADILDASPRQVAQRRHAERIGQAGRGGLPPQLKAGIESLSGLAMDDVRVHYNSPQPAQMQAHAYAQGRDIYLAPSQERHLAHEAWHIVQQAQGRVRPTRQMKAGVPVNDDDGLEREADLMGARALQMAPRDDDAPRPMPVSAGAVGQRAVVQRVGAGGEKLGFEKVETGEGERKAKVETGFRLLQDCWDSAREPRRAAKAALGGTMADYDQAYVQHYPQYREAQLALSGLDEGAATYADAKNAIETDARYQPALAAFAPFGDDGKRGLTHFYAAQLNAMHDEKTLLMNAIALSPSLSLSGTDIMYDSGDGKLLKIATMHTGASAFRISPWTPENDGRAVYAKHGARDAAEPGLNKEYVKDDHSGAFTRRYAYVEKNYHQMMEFFVTQNLTGRFQQYMMAAGDAAPNIRTITTDMIKNVRAKKVGAQLTTTQMAVAHQMYGSLPEQRGVSMTATPKVGVTYVNTGSNFRTKDGFRLKIDLAKVPSDVLLLNHYASGGISSMAPTDYSVRQKHHGKNQNYKYVESALHARELFIEKIQPAWVVEIEHHAVGGYNGGATGTVVGGADPFNEARAAFGGPNYERGIEFGLKGSALDPASVENDHYKQGVSAGLLVHAGYAKGKLKTDTSGVVDRLTAFKEVSKFKPERQKMSQFQIGYMRGRLQQAPITSAAELKTALG